MPYTVMIGKCNSHIKWPACQCYSGEIFYSEIQSIFALANWSSSIKILYQKHSDQKKGNNIAHIIVKTSKHTQDKINEIEFDTPSQENSQDGLF